MSATDGDTDLEAQDFAQFDVPDCASCGGMLKPDVVFFGENVPRDRVDAVRPPLARADAVLTLKVEHEVGAALHALAAAPLRQPPSQTQ